MDDVCIEVTCNWSWRSESADLSQSVKTQKETEDIFIKPKVEEIISEERAILLSKPEVVQDACKLHFQLQPQYKIAAISFVCTTPKLEIYLGQQLEYGETYFGEQIDDEFSYIYHIDIQRSGITQIELKFITSEDNICIFGIIMQMAPNPNGITTQQNINMESVQEILNKASKDMSPKAEKCKLFLEMMSKMSVLPETVGSTAYNTTCSSTKSLAHSIPGTESATEFSRQLINFEKSIKQHIDNRFLELEFRINARFEIIDTKFTQILKHLTEKNQQ